MLLILRIDIYVDLHVFAMSLCIFILQSKVTPNILIDSLCGITSVPTVSVMCLTDSWFVLNMVKSVLSWLILREVFLIPSHTSVIQSSSCFIACLIEVRHYYTQCIFGCHRHSYDNKHDACSLCLPSDGCT